jgi:hypothetical protein
MNRHSLTYIEMYPEPLKTEEPSPLMIWAGAAFALGALYLVTVFLFSL